MSKAQTRRGTGRSGSGQAGTNAKGRTAARSGSASANAARAGAKTSGGSQRGSAGGRPASAAQRGQAGGARAATASGTPKRPAAATAKVTAARAGAPARRKRWLLGMTSIEASTLLLSLIGLGIGVYATILHYDTSLKPFCSATGIVNCESVMTSPESVVFGVLPVAVLGMAFYLFMIVINSPWAWRGKFPAFLGGRAINSRPDVIKRTRLGAVVVGMGFAIYLIYAELVQIGNICLWCTGVHIVTFLLFVIIVFNASFSWGRTDTPLQT